MRILLASALIAGSALGAAALHGCSPYDPTLSEAPFLCGDSDPQCPDGFTCVDDGTGRMVCLAPNGQVPDAPPPDAGFACADDHLVEGDQKNDTIATAFITNIDGTAAHLTGSYSDLAICPAGDRDTYAVTVRDQGTTHANLEAITSWGSGKTVSVTILTAGGQAIANSMAVTGENQQRAYVANLNAGTYYIQAYGAASTENNYGLKITISY